MTDNAQKDERVLRVAIEKVPQTRLERLSSQVPLFISIVALSLSLWSAYATREHDKLTTRPDVIVNMGLAGKVPSAVGLSLRNDGFGPAILSHYRIYLDGVRVQSYEALRDAVQNLQRPAIPAQITTLASKTALRAGDSRALLSVDSAAIAESSRDNFNKLLKNRIALFVNTCSAYKECELVCLLPEGTRASCITELKRLDPSGQ